MASIDVLKHLITNEMNFQSKTAFKLKENNAVEYVTMNTNLVESSRKADPVSHSCIEKVKRISSGTAEERWSSWFVAPSVVFL